MQGPETIILPAMIYLIAALSFSSLMNYFVNPAVKDLRKGIEGMWEGIAELKSGLQGVLETTSFFRGS